MLGCVPESANRAGQMGECGLPFSDRFVNRIDDQTSLRVDYFPSLGRQLEASRVFDHPADLLKVFPGTPA
jgi:hypothetical protein